MKITNKKNLLVNKFSQIIPLNVYQKVNMNYYGFDKYDEFKKDLFEYFKVQENPKAKVAYSIAYEYGHSAGFSEILYYFSDIVQLIK